MRLHGLLGLVGVETGTLVAAGFLAGFSSALSITCLISSECNPCALMTLSASVSEKQAYNG